ncbi:MAG: hypothetical protein MO852_00015 [Candidatus Devosia euplotis]|nr:hypothetical protein [Candidatus Devosia euplotis]
MAGLRLGAANVIVCATHTHGAPVSMQDRLGAGADPQFLHRLEDGCVLAIDSALVNAWAGRLSFGNGADPDVARNRRHDDGLLDRSLPVLRLSDAVIVLAEGQTLTEGSFAHVAANPQVQKAYLGSRK